MARRAPFQGTPLTFVWLVVVATSAVAAPRDPLPSWNAGKAKDAVVAFVRAATHKGSAGFVPIDERIAVFDNDGTLWPEQPVYVQLQFAIDRVKVLAVEHSEWKVQQPFKAVLEGDMASLAASGEHGIAELVMASHAGMTTDEFARIVIDWLAMARHSQPKRFPSLRLARRRGGDGSLRDAFARLDNQTNRIS